ncbi:hypothetical protein MCUN1_002916 [Malassezia cuniculi]|uniref:NAD(P)-binding protein n=1 Tax=Malassezia cuniculi TaxID=948313 RepID=A0AAF0J7F2_9BASI|nr:hypothetical protein MCUN1_002916 [Malassezia cuniculi]
MSLRVQIIAVALALAVAARLLRAQKLRSNAIPPASERVVILGASTVNGIGAAIAAKALARGVRQIMLVGRNAQGLREVKEHLSASAGCSASIVIHAADCTRDADVLATRDTVVAEFGGVDTLHIVFGSIVDETLLGAAGADPIRQDGGAVTSDGLANVHAAMDASCTLNVTGTALVLAAFIPLLQTSSRHPHVGVIGSLASLIPAPTRALYAAVKSAQQQLVLGVATECTSQAKIPGNSHVKFTVFAPGSVATSFSTTEARASAIPPSKVADTVIRAIDHGHTGVIPIPHKYFAAWMLSIFWCVSADSPNMIERSAHAKYGY